LQEETSSGAKNIQALGPVKMLFRRPVDGAQRPQKKFLAPSCKVLAPL